LMISLLNYINLATARAVTRAKEVGVRKVLGSTNGSIMSQFIVESVLFTVGSGALAVFLVFLLMPQLNQLFQIELSLVSLNLVDWIIYGASLIFMGAIAGVLPAYAMSKLPSITQSSNNDKPAASQWSITRKLFVGIQYAVALAFLAATLVVFMQYQYLKNYDLGFNPKQLINISIEDRNLQAKIDLIKSEIKNIPGVDGAAATGENLPSDLNNTWNFTWQEAEPDLAAGIDVIGVDFDYFELLDIPFVEGENFRKSYEVDSANSVILNEEALTFMSKESMLNEQVNIDGRNRTVVGVIKNYHNISLHSEMQPYAYFIFDKGLRVSTDNILIKVETAQVGQVISTLEKVWNSFSSDPLPYQFVDEAFANAYASERRFSSLIGSFSILAVFISIIGLFGLISFIVQLKLKEIGIRRVLGAGRFSLLKLLSKDFLIVFGIASLLALPFTYYFLKNWLSNYAYHISLNPWIMMPAVVMCLAISLLVIFYNLERTTRLNPSEVIRRE
ncbi:MAG: FtsX-like permease family protein, partial [Bacteroidota bacterium]